LLESVFHEHRAAGGPKTAVDATPNSSNLLGQETSARGFAAKGEGTEHDDTATVIVYCYNWAQLQCEMPFSVAVLQ